MPAETWSYLRFNQARKQSRDHRRRLVIHIAVDLN